MDLVNEKGYYSSNDKRDGASRKVFIHNNPLSL